ncbi:hypothetical protein BHE74_00033171 [Ensete ventricosum]|nr:hypothetical protein GW17_00055230 [Ensete ventricosum]RWW59871.1 hypothetical protein BHE74_00033171 [Ensete ventricosum]
MNRVAGSKKPTKPIAADGVAKSNTVRTENTQNIPKRALGNLIAAATKACFRSLSAARIAPSDTARCKIAITWNNSRTRTWLTFDRIDVGPPSVPADLAAIRPGGLAFSFHRKYRVYPGMQRDRSGTAFERRAGAVERGAECPTGNLERSESGGAMIIGLTDAVAMDRGGGGGGFEQGSSSAASYAAATARECVDDSVCIPCVRSIAVSCGRK